MNDPYWLTFDLQARSDRQPLEEIFPLVFTWACNPKEASVGLIKKYLVANYPDLDLGVEMKHYRLTIRWYVLFITLCWFQESLGECREERHLGASQWQGVQRHLSARRRR